MKQYFSDTCNVLTNLDAVSDSPFPYAATQACLPSELYKELVCARPSYEIIVGKKPKPSNSRVDMSAIAVLRNENVKSIWKDFVLYHTSHDFYLQVIKKFAKYFPGMEHKRTAIRGSGNKADVYLDCQIGVNTPTKIKGTVGGPHLDAKEQIWAGLMYMRDLSDNAGGDLSIYECSGEPKMYGKRQVDRANLVERAKILYEPNTFVCFASTPRSIHGVGEREITDKPRLLVNFVMEVA